MLKFDKKENISEKQLMSILERYEGYHNDNINDNFYSNAFDDAWMDYVNLEQLTKELNNISVKKKKKKSPKP